MDKDLKPELLSGATDITLPQSTVLSFKTSKGSIYTYHGDHTTRHKTKTGIEQPEQDLTVFIDGGIKDIPIVIGAYLLRSSVDRFRAVVVEGQPDGQFRAIHDARDVSAPDSLRIATLRDGCIVRSRPASLYPRIGAYPYESRRYKKDGRIRTERHLGHKVISIETG